MDRTTCLQTHRDSQLCLKGKNTQFLFLMSWIICLKRWKRWQMLKQLFTRALSKTDISKGCDQYNRIIDLMTQNNHTMTPNIQLRLFFKSSCCTNALQKVQCYTDRQLHNTEMKPTTWKKTGPHTLMYESRLNINRTTHIQFWGNDSEHSCNIICTFSESLISVSPPAFLLFLVKPSLTHIVHRKGFLQLLWKFCKITSSSR